VNTFFAHDSADPVVLRRIVVEVYWAHHDRYDSSGRVFGPSPKTLPEETQHSQEIDFICAAGFEPAIPASKRALFHALKPCGQWDRPVNKRNRIL